MNSIADQAAATEAGQYITCALDAAEYGIDIMAVQEIKGWSETTAIPQAPSWVRGVINLRGTIVPILDLRARFGMPMTQPTAMHVVVIVRIGSRTLGLLADAVSDIITVAPESIRAVPDLGTTQEQELIIGLVPTERGMVSLLALDALLQMPAEAA